MAAERVRLSGHCRGHVCGRAAASWVGVADAQSCNIALLMFLIVFCFNSRIYSVGLRSIRHRLPRGQFAPRRLCCRALVRRSVCVDRQGQE